MTRTASILAFTGICLTAAGGALAQAPSSESRPDCGGTILSRLTDCGGTILSRLDDCGGTILSRLQQVHEDLGV
jgi:hypothetical protein